MRTIWKFEVLTLKIVLTLRVQVTMPVGARVLSAAFQGESLFVWADVPDTEAPTTMREFYVAGTGHSLPNDCGDFVGTAFHQEGLVFHVFVFPEGP